MYELQTPSVDSAELTDLLYEAWGVTRGVPLTQYLAWSEASGLTNALNGHQGMSPEALCHNTFLNERGVDALLCILMCLKVAHRTPNAGYTLTAVAREYLVQSSPYYIGYALYAGRDEPVPSLYVKNHGGCNVGIDEGAKHNPNRLARLRLQHSRNFAACVTAARTSGLKEVKHLVDIGGGTGVFAIPLVLDNPKMRVTLVDLPDALDGIRPFLSRYGVEKQIELIGMDATSQAWRFPPFDGLLFGNVFHCYCDELCSVLVHKGFAALSPSGTVWLHEVLFNNERDGPLVAALWNANMAALRPGARQRTAIELITLLREGGFVDCAVQAAAGRFSLVTAFKPQ
jgi:hypothetical protein